MQAVANELVHASKGRKMGQTKMKEAPVRPLGAPRIENSKALLIAGLRRRYSGETMKHIPAQWQSFAPHIGKIPGQVGRMAYGLCWDSDGGLDYLTGVEVSSSAVLPNEFSAAIIPAQRYAVFSHREHVSRLYETCEAIPLWFIGSNYERTVRVGETPDFFERYTDEFDLRTGMGGIEVWVLVKL
jgi:AraC family transcriptional regulator